MKEVEAIDASIYSLMKQMDKSEKLVVPIDQWARVRNYAAQLKRNFGVQFEIHRMHTSRMKRDLLLITRKE